MEHGVSYDRRLDLLVHCLCRYERRLALEYLAVRDAAVDIEELAAVIVRESAVEKESAKQARSHVSQALRYRHLPLLATTGMVSVEGNTVELEDERVPSVVDCVREAARNLLDRTTPALTPDGPPVTRTLHEPGAGQRLSETITDAIDQHKGEDLSRGDYLLFDDLNSQAVDDLFKADAAPHTRVSFTTESVHVELWSDDGVEIRVTDAIAG